MHGVKGDVMAEEAWTTRIVDELLSLRAWGEYDFERAWERAIGLHPYAGGSRSPGGEKFSAWFQRMCSREWHGLVYVDYAGLAAIAAALDEGGVTAVGHNGRSKGVVALLT
jgi:hypothetical protein